nr:MAG TPA: hypothetical protein [Caudoviricetes sp.]
MITVKDIITEVRYKQKDNNEVRFSDYDIIKSLNEALRYINRSFALKNSDFLEKIKEYRLDDINEEIRKYNETATTPKELMTFEDGFDLPDDLLTIVSVVTPRREIPLSPCNAQKKPHWREFKVINNKLYVHEDVDLLYRYSLSAVTADDSIDFPPAFIDLFVKLTGMILNNNPEEDVMAEANKSLAEELIPSRRYAFRIIRPIWKV